MIARTFQSRYQYLYNVQRNILDGSLLYQYLSLTTKEKLDFAKQIGTTQAQVSGCSLSLSAIYDCGMLTYSN